MTLFDFYSLKSLISNIIVCDIILLY